MTTSGKPWLALGLPPKHWIHCASCGQEFDATGMTADHHPSVCPRGGVECLFLYWKGHAVQIVTESAPPTLLRLIRWAQQNLDELEFTELLCDLEGLADALACPDGSTSVPS
jgi:hypothetical protein